MRKYRPYLTLPDLIHLRDLCTSVNQISPLSRYLTRYVDEIQNGHIKEQITLAQTIEDKLGFTVPNPGATPAWDKLQETRYLSNLMTPEEEKDYEKSQGISF